ncbi:MAG: ATP-binding protein [Chloroflexota bacterium]
MIQFTFEQATKEQVCARIALVGPTGSGKTYTSLKLASHMFKRIAVIDTENGSASRYADEFNFQRLNLTEHSPGHYIAAIHAAEQAGFEALIIDSLSHAWTGRGGALEMVDQAAARYRNNSFAAWRDVTPHHNALVNALVQCQCHLIVTMRAKTEWVINQSGNGKGIPQKIGLAPVQRDGLEYEFDIVADMDDKHNFIVSKTRCKALDNRVVSLPGAELAQEILTWLQDGEPPKPQPRSMTASRARELFGDADNMTDYVCWLKQFTQDWQSKGQAIHWAMGQGVYDNEYHCEQSWQNIKKAKFADLGIHDCQDEFYLAWAHKVKVKVKAKQDAILAEEQDYTEDDSYLADEQSALVGEFYQ